MSVTISAVDDAPVISAIGNQSLNEAASINIPFTITDVDSAVGTPTVSSSNTNIASTSLSGSYLLTVTAGLFTAGPKATITISVPGATRTFDVTLNNLDPELWIEQSGTIGQYNLRWNYGTHYVKIFENGVDVTQALTNSAHAGIVGSVPVKKTANGTFSYYLQDCVAGQYQPTCSGNYSPKSINVVFPAPTVTASINPATINEAGSATLTWSSTNASSCSATNISGVSATSGTATFNAPTNMSANQSIDIVVTCSGKGGSASKTVPVTINWVNDSPVITTPSSTVAAVEDTAFTIPFTISDEETAAASLVVTATSSDATKIASISVDRTNNRLNVTPVANAYGNVSITMRVTDNATPALYQEKTVSVTISAVDDAPVISAISNQSLNEAASINIPFTITDVDSAVGTPTVSSSNTNIASTSLSGSYLLTVTAGLFTSGSQATVTISVPGATRTFTVTLNNLPPELWIEPTGTIGEYGLRWNYGTHYVKIFENGVDVTQALTNSAHAGIVGSVPVKKTANGTFSYYLQDCVAGQYQPTCSGNYSPKSITVTFPLPVVTASVSVSTINEGGTTSLTWSSTNASSCSATNISGVTGTSGTATFTAPSGATANQIQTINIEVTCTGPGGSVSRTVPVTVTPSSPESILGLVPVNPADDAMTEPEYLGALTGVQSVGLDGSFNYSVPLSIPVGIGGVQPKLQLNYNSNAKNGLLGWGWSLNGLSVISRCNATMIRDGYTSGIQANDNYKYCLDGQRLVEVAAGEYRTESESFLRIKKLGDYWEVTNNNGTQSRYGFNTDSKLEDDESQSYAWYLDQQKDISGNSWSVIYTKSSVDSIQTHYPASISYTENPLFSALHSVVFHYENRDDISVKYVAGMRVKSDKRLTKVEVKTGSATVHSYVLKYQQSGQAYHGKSYSDPAKTSRLSAVKQCIGSSSTTCTAPVEFDWNLQTKSNYMFTAVDSPAPASPDSTWLDINGDGVLEPNTTALPEPSSYEAGNTIVGASLTRIDMNQDGRDDIVWNGSTGLKVFLSNGTTINEISAPGFDIAKSELTFEAKVTHQLITANPNEAYTKVFPETGTASMSYKLQYVDVNADGYVDLIRAPNCSGARDEGCSYSPSPNDISVALNNNGTGFFSFQTWLNGLYGGVLENHSVNFIDLNGDGSKDLFAPVDYRSPITSLPVFIGTSNGTGSSTSINLQGKYFSEMLFGFMGDFNGDGVSDLATLKKAVNGTITSGEPGAFSISLGIGKPVNAGGPAPGFVAAVTTPVGHKYLRFCGNGALPFAQTAKTYDRCNRAVVDFNSDGLDDIVESGVRISRTCLVPLGDDMQKYCSKVEETIIEHEAQVFLSLGADTQGNPAFAAPVAYRDWSSFQWAYPGVAASETGMISRALKFEDFDSNGAHEDHYRLKNNVIPNRIEAVLESARRIDVQYSTLASNTIYDVIPTDVTIDDELGYVKQTKTLAKRLGVKKIEISNGIGGTNKTEYKYKGAKTHGSGYGDLGFAEVEKLETIAGKTPLKTITKYYQTANAQYKLAGRVKQQLVYTSNSAGELLQLLSDNLNQWKVRTYSDDLDTGMDSPHYFAYLYQSSNQSWDLDGTKIADSQSWNHAGTVVSCDPLVESPTESPEIIVSSAGGSGDVDYSADGVLLFSQSATCDESGSSASVQIKALENLDITSKGNARGLVQKSKQYAWIGNAVGSAAKSVYDVRTQSFTYNDLGQLETKTIEPDATSPASVKLTSTYAYNDYGSVSSITDTWDDVTNDGLSVNSRVTTINETYDANGVRKLVVTKPLSISETTEFHSVWGVPTKQTDANNLVTGTLYDAQGRPITINYADGTSTKISYRTCSNCFSYNTKAVWYKQVKTTGSSAVRTYYDGFDREVGSRTSGMDGTAIYTVQTYNSRGDAYQTTAPFFYGETQKTVTTDYDALGRISSISYPDSSHETRGYSGLTHTTTNRLNQTQTRYLNAAGWVMQSVDNAGTPVDFTYWSFGDLKTTQVNNNASTLVSVAYDVLGRKTSMTDPNTGTTTYTYNALDLIATQIDAKNQRTCFGYDALGRQTKRVDNASSTCTGTTQNWVYDTKTKGKGQLGSMSGVNTDGSSYTEQYSYTSYGLPATTTSNFDGATYTVTQHYDAFNRPLGVTYPTGYIVANSYNSYGYLEQVKDSTSTTLWTANEADALGNLEQFTLGNGVVTTQTYDADTNRIESIRAVKGSLVIQDQGYQFDALGNLTSREDRKNTVTQSFCYDGLNRLKAARFNGCSSAANDYNYDPLGNLTTKEGLTGTLGYGTSGSNVAGPHAITSANGWAYQYDAIGNLKTATKAGQQTKTVNYSPFNTPTSITQGSKFSTLVYGPNQDRIKHSDSNGRVTKYVGGIYEEVTKAGVTQKIHYVGDFALMIQTGGATPTNSYEYLHRDHIGSIVAISKGTVASANDINWQSNGAWGERRYQQWNGPLDNLLIPTSTAKGFTDHEHLDAVGLIHMNGRVYDPELGRFMSADPFVQAPYNSQSYNRYSYVFNNPLSFTDPSGYSAESDCNNQNAGVGHAPGGSCVEEVTVTGSQDEYYANLWNMAFTNSNNLMYFMSMERMTESFNKMQMDQQMGKLELLAQHQAILGIDNSGTLKQLGALGVAGAIGNLGGISTASGGVVSGARGLATGWKLGSPWAVLALAVTPTKIAEDTEAERNPTYVSYRAPHSYELPMILSVGFQSANYPGEGLYLTWDRMTAGRYANAYGAGVVEIYTKQSVMDQLQGGGFIQRDRLETGAFNILPGGIDIFNQGSTIRYVPPGSYELYDQFNAR